MNGKGVLSGCTSMIVLPWHYIEITEKNYEYLSPGGISQAEIQVVSSGILVRDGVNAVLACLLFPVLTCHMQSSNTFLSAVLHVSALIT
jgi:hypothetical protein